MTARVPTLDSDGTIPARFLPASSSDLSGTGQPNGVVTAGVGTLYFDTAVTTGASVWIKTSGTGNTGWTVLYGDTGPRNITSLVTSTLQTSNPNLTVWVQRQNATVRYSIWEAATGTWGTAVVLENLPTGFAVPNAPGGAKSVGQPCISPSSGLPLNATLYVDAVTAGQGLRVLGAASDVRHVAQLSFLTSEAWPTVLPGVAA